LLNIFFSKENFNSSNYDQEFSASVHIYKKFAEFNIAVVALPHAYPAPVLDMAATMVIPSPAAIVRCAKTREFPGHL
jgi:hypothetical protein